MIDVENIKHIAENKRLIGDMVEKTVTDWESQKKSFYEQTGVRPAPHEEENEMAHQKNSNENRKRKEACGDHEGNENDEDQDDFEKELEEALLFEPEDDNEEVEPTDEDDT